MESSSQNSPDTLCAEILAQARRKGDEIRRRADAEASSLRAIAASEAERMRHELLEEARRKARRRKEIILATVAVEKQRMHSTRVETLLEVIRREILRRLAASNMDSRELVVALAMEAISRMAEEHFVLEIANGEHQWETAGLVEEIRRRTGRPGLSLQIVASAGNAQSGVIVRNPAGSQFWDNRLSARLDRFWPELRRQIAVAGGLDGKMNSSEGPI